MPNDVRAEAIAEVIGALEECLTEIIVLTARVTPAVKANLEATAERAQEALSKAKAAGLEK